MNPEILKCSHALIVIANAGSAAVNIPYGLWEFFHNYNQMGILQLCIGLGCLGAFDYLQKTYTEEYND